MLVVWVALPSFEVAVMTTTPGNTPRTTPEELIVALVSSPEDQLTPGVVGGVPPSFTRAVSVMVSPTFTTAGEAGA